MTLSSPALIRQFTATAYIIQDEAVLLIFHKKLQKWLPPGGHIDPNELPSECAIREAKEETGLEIALLSDDPLQIKEYNATTFPRPYLCLLEEIPTFGDQPAHQHMDFIYLARPLGGKVQENPNESNGIRWFTIEDLTRMPENQIFDETKQVISSILR